MVRRHAGRVFSWFCVSSHKLIIRNRASSFSPDKPRLFVFERVYFGQKHEGKFVRQLVEWQSANITSFESRDVNLLLMPNWKEIDPS